MNRDRSANRPVLGLLDGRCIAKSQILATKSGADPMSVTVGRTDARTHGRTDGRTDGRTNKHENF